MLTYAGVPLEFALPETAAWITANISTRDVYEFTAVEAAEYGLPYLTFPGVFNNDAMPTRKVKINSLWWPNGISRWAIGHFLVTASNLTAIRQAVNGANNTTYLSSLLVMDPETGVAQEHVETQMFMLPPRPLAQNKGQGTDDELYLLTLVDERYFLWRPASQLMITENTTTWNSLYLGLASILGITLNVETITAAYLFPSGKFTSFFEHVPPILDAVAYNVGQRIVRQLDGTYTAENVTTALADELTDLSMVDFTGLIPNSVWKKQAGGKFFLRGNDNPHDLNDFVPSAIDIAFPGTIPGMTYVSSTALLSLSIPQYGLTVGDGTTQFFQEIGAYAVFATQDDTSPCNQAELDALSQQFAFDWYRWQLGRLDLKLISPDPWRMEGLDDTVEFMYEKDEISTRIIRAPWNDLNNRLMHASSNCCCSPSSSSSQSSSGSSTSSSSTSWTNPCCSSVPDTLHAALNFSGFAMTDVLVGGPTCWSGQVDIPGGRGKIFLELCCGIHPLTSKTCPPSNWVLYVIWQGADGGTECAAPFCPSSFSCPPLNLVFVGTCVGNITITP